MATNLNLPDSFNEEIISNVKDTAAVMQLANVVAAPKKRDAVQYAMNFTPAAFHNATGASKNVSNETVENIEIAMSTLYKMLNFKDWEYSDSVELVDQIANELPKVIQSTLDILAAGGTVSGARFEGYTTPAVEVDETSASWAAVIDAISAAGETANGAILDNSFKALLRQASTEGTQVNPLNVNVTDGFQLGGVTFYFRNLGEGVGVVGNFDKAVLAINGSVELRKFLPEDNYELQKENLMAVYAGLRVGYAVQNQDAFIPVTVGAAE